MVTWMEPIVGLLIETIRRRQVELVIMVYASPATCDVLYFPEQGRCLVVDGEFEVVGGQAEVMGYGLIV